MIERIDAPFDILGESCAAVLLETFETHVGSRRRMLHAADAATGRVRGIKWHHCIDGRGINNNECIWGCQKGRVAWKRVHRYAVDSCTERDRRIGRCCAGDNRLGETLRGIIW